MTRKNKFKLAAAALLSWLTAVACKISIESYFGGVGDAIKNMFNSLARSIRF